MKSSALYLIALGILLFNPFGLLAQDIHWTLSNSPIHIIQDLTIGLNQKLIIDPGVVVSFDGHYKINLQGRIQAQGTAAQPITFKATDTAQFSNPFEYTVGWAGFNIQYSYITDIKDTFSYCNIQDIKSTNANEQFITSRSVYFNNCNIFHNLLPNNNMGASGIFYLNTYATDGEIKFNNCNFYDNESFISIVFISVGNVEIKNCTFQENRGRYGVYIVSNYADSITVENNDFSNNNFLLYQSGTPLIIYNAAQVNITKNVFYKNISQWGVGAIKLGNSRGLVERNLIINNDIPTVPGTLCPPIAGGIINISRDTPSVAREITDVTLRNNILSNNSTSSISPILIYNSNCHIINNTITNNFYQYGLAKGGSSLLIFGDSKVLFKNNILYNNNSINFPASPYEIEVKDGSQLSFDYNFIEKSTLESVHTDSLSFIIGDTLHNLIALDPGIQSLPVLFGAEHDAFNSNFSLLDSSVCIDKGFTLDAGPFDYAGNDRVRGLIDIGAYEFQKGGSTAILPHVTTKSSLISIWPNPATDNVMLLLPEPSGQIQVYDMAGKLLFAEKCTSTLITIPLHQFATGSYLFKWESEKSKLVQTKILIKK